MKTRTPERVPYVRPVRCKASVDFGSSFGECACEHEAGHSGAHVANTVPRIHTTSEGERRFDGAKVSITW